jgi:hypothetical protein
MTLAYVLEHRFQGWRLRCALAGGLILEYLIELDSIKLTYCALI